MTLPENSRLEVRTRVFVAASVNDAVVSEPMVLWEAEQELGRRSAMHSRQLRKVH